MAYVSADAQGKDGKWHRYTRSIYRNHFLSRDASDLYFWSSALSYNRRIYVQNCQDPFHFMQ